MRIRRILKNLPNLPAFVRLVRRFEETKAVWVSEAADLPPDWLGSTHDFWWYLEGKSSVSVSSVEDICAWLAECEYERDADLFRERDFWQHPLTFEKLRRGDCEDHALWAWRKLGELGLAARLFVGRWRQDGERAGMHAWTTFRDGENEWVLEGTGRNATAMLRPLIEAQAEYIPHLSVGHRRDVRIYGGYVQYRAAARDERKQARKERSGTESA